METKVEKQLDENILLKLKLASTEIELERTRIDLYAREAEAGKVKLEKMQKSLESFVEGIKDSLDEQGYELTKIDLEKGVVDVVEIEKPSEDGNSESTEAAPASSEPSQPAPLQPEG